MECKMHHGSLEKVEVEGHEGVPPWNLEVRVNFVLGLYWFYGITLICQVNFYYIYQKAGGVRTKVPCGRCGGK